MSKIRILPEIVSNKIAAGEVVERPASVIKELVENALDAESTRIVIEVEGGGRRTIRVSDNGGGMDRDDALLALERYATSKIASDTDLFSIRTLGFRGEALPSIAAVSRLTIVTREKQADAGTEIRVSGGKIEHVAETGAPPGTMVTVENLFFNTPARRKFMKSVATEMGHIADSIAGIALGHPEVYFRLVHDGRALKSWPAAVDRLDRVAAVLGAGLRGYLYPVARQADCGAVSGWVSDPKQFRSTSRGVFVFVNGRHVRDRVVQHALLAGYRQRLVKGQYPVATLFIGIPHDQVDVNVHPTKNEVRFAQQHLIHGLVQAAVSETLECLNRPQWGRTEEPRPAFLRKDPCIAENREISYGAEGPRRGAETANGRAHEPPGQEGGEGRAAQAPYGAGRGRDDFAQNGTGRTLPGRPRQTAPQAVDGRLPEQAALWEKTGFGGLRLIGQLHNSYVLCESEGGLVLVDQHAAHERILYERLRRRSERLKTEAQRLLVPETIELSFHEAVVLERLMAEFDAFGLEIEPFGTNTFVVRSVPAMLAGRDIATLVREIVETLAAEGFGDGPEAPLDASLKLIACHGAIRAHQALSDRQIRELLSGLDACENPSNCPHGRPTWLRWSIRELEKSFKR
ncbi:MAG: DNA mismatch repair endonuclease MutL [Deltaproteobacteria bacterium]|nr:DNA mismatch repair endonuclease MutL [Deltaproteobacteria bacterium]